MTLQNCLKYRGCLRVNKYHYDVKQAKQAGGCATYRNYEREERQLEALRQKWDSRIVRIDQSNKGKTKKHKAKFDFNPIIKVPIKGVQGGRRGMAAENQNLQSTQVIAKIFGVSTRRVEQLKTEGIIKGQGKPTKYDLLPTIQAYIKYLSDKANGREKKQADAQLETAKLEAEKRIKTAKAEMAEIELKELRGKMHRAEDVEVIMTDHVFFLRSMLMAMPGKLAVDLAGTHTAAEQADRVKQEVYYILENLAGYKYDPEEYKRRVMERQGWDSNHADGKETDEDE